MPGFYRRTVPSKCGASGSKRPARKTSISTPAASNVAQNLAQTRNALLAIIPFDEKNNLPSLIVDYQDRKQLAIDLILKARPFP
jgi:hypothetical protein